MDSHDDLTENSVENFCVSQFCKAIEKIREKTVWIRLLKWFDRISNDNWSSYKMNTLKNVRPIERIAESLKKAKVLQDHLNSFVIFQDEHALEKQAQANIKKPLVLWPSVSTDDKSSFHEFSWKLVELQFKVHISAE